MKVILTRDVAKVGKRGEVKEVSSGFARNVLLPKKLAVLATPDNMNRLTKEKEFEDKKIFEKKKLFSDIKDKLEKEGVSFIRKANQEGHLFAGISVDDIIKEIFQSYKLSLKREDIGLLHAIKSVGLHQVPVSYQEEKAVLKVKVDGRD